MDYNSIVDQIKAWTTRSDAAFTDQIPSFIDQAIKRIFIEIEDLGLETTLTGSDNFLEANQRLIDKPNDWRQTISMEYVNIDSDPPETIFLKPRSYEFCRSYWPDPTVTGLPEFYADYAYDSFVIVPTPDRDYAGQMIYLSLPILNSIFASPSAISIMARYPGIVINACLEIANNYLQNYEKSKVYEAQYQRDLQDINRNNKRTIVDRTAKRDAN